MRINQNISAMNTYSRLTSANTAKSGSLAKLSSGLRINKAGDDAAGLAISEKMRGQVGGLKQAVRNAQDGISLIQTAEGALTETHSILQRMRDLAVQSANGTNTDSDRKEIQKEVNQLADELTRISTDTQFNTRNLLGGKFSTSFHIGANEDQNMDLKIGAMDSRTLGVSGIGGASFEVAAGAITTGDLANGSYDVVKVDGGYELLNSKGEAVATSTNGKVYTTTAETPKTITFQETVISGQVKVADTKVTGMGTDTKTKLENGSYTIVVSDDIDFLEADKFALLDKDNNVVAISDDGKDWTDKNGDTVLTRVEALDKDDFIAEVVVGSEGGIDVLSQTSADAAITKINDAIETVSAERSKLGATQNRLDHTINNLTATAENLSAAESRIRDVDMAEEMMEFTKNNILSQAATSMLAQANQMPQSVLQLLQ